MRQAISIEALKDALLARLEDVIDRYAPPAAGAHRTMGRYFTLNPGRADRSVGSFCIWVTGPDAGRWVDFASHPRGGDVLDLIALSLGFTDPVDAIKEARAFLGLEHESPEHRRAREAAALRAAERRAAEAQARAERAERSRRAAQGLWLSGQERVQGTPVDAYLRGRGIDLSRLGWQPRAIRYHAECLYYPAEEERIDAATGEITTRRAAPLKLPAMVTNICGPDGKQIGCHRTYLALDPDTGRWTKARLVDAKKVLGQVMGGSVRLSSGMGPRGGKGARLNDCPPGTRVYIAEGIETGLSAVMLRPEARVLAAVSLANMGAVVLPDNVAEVVLIADADAAPEARAALDRAIAAHAAKGRVVRLVQSPETGRDFNDRLRDALQAERVA